MSIQQEMAINPLTILGKKEIAQAVEYCTTGTTSVPSEALPWMLSYLCDRNSSSVREGITAHVTGYIWSQKKHDYDAFKILSGGGMSPVEIKQKVQPVEIKPKMFFGSKQKNGGNGNFSDLTLPKVRQMKKDKALMVVSLFAYTRLVYVIEFPFSTIYDKIYSLVKISEDRGNRFCRNATFAWKDYIDSKNFRVIYLDKPRLLGYKCTSKFFAKALLARA